MIPSLPIGVNRLIVLRALQSKPHIYGGTALPKDAKRKQKRLRKLERNERRLRHKDLEDHARDVGFVAAYDEAV